MTDDQVLEDTLNAHEEEGWHTVAAVPAGDELVLVQWGADPVPPFAHALTDLG